MEAAAAAMIRRLQTDRAELAALSDEQLAATAFAWQPTPVSVEYAASPEEQRRLIYDWVVRQAELVRCCSCFVKICATLQPGKHTSLPGKPARLL